MHRSTKPAIVFQAWAATYAAWRGMKITFLSFFSAMRSRPFVEDAIKLASEHNDLLPRSHDPAVLRSKLDTVESLRDISSAVQILAGKLHETLTVAGAELYEDARLIYALAKTGVRPSGLESAREKLGARFKTGRGRKVPGETPEMTPEAA